MHRRKRICGGDGFQSTARGRRARPRPVCAPRPRAPPISPKRKRAAARRREPARLSGWRTVTPPRAKSRERRTAAKPAPPAQRRIRRNSLPRRPHARRPRKPAPASLGSETVIRSKPAPVASAHARTPPPAQPSSARSVRRRAQPPRSRSAVPGAGEPYPPLSERLLNGVSAASAAAKRTEPNASIRAVRAPRSSRTTSKCRRGAPARARHPLVIVGNAVISLFLMLGGRRRLRRSMSASSGSRRRARWRRTASSTFRTAPASATSPTCCMREGVIDQPWVFIGGVLVLKAREDLKAGEYQFKAHASAARRGCHHRRRQGGRCIRSAFPKA